MNLVGKVGMKETNKKKNNQSIFSFNSAVFIERILHLHITYVILFIVYILSLKRCVTFDYSPLIHRSFSYRTLKLVPRRCTALLDTSTRASRTSFPSPPSTIALKLIFPIFYCQCIPKRNNRARLIGSVFMHCTTITKIVMIQHKVR